MRGLNHLLAAGLFFSVVQATAFQTTTIRPKIVGGVEASIGEFPFIVSLQTRSGRHFCGGSLITRKWVLTAAHCHMSPGSLRVVVGLHSQRDSATAERLAVKQYLVHPKYDANANDFDFGLIELETESRFEPIATNQADFAIPDNANEWIMSTTAGWGALRQGSGSLPDKLQKVDVPLVSKERCNRSYENTITDTMICAGYDEGGKDSCQGDSGGPLLVEDQATKQRVLVGVVSWGQGCAQKDYYGVYSKVSAAQEWINQVVQ